MDGASVTLDKVSIQIEANANTASSNINQLTQTLSELRGAVKGGFNNLSKLADSLEKLKAASTDLQSLSANLQPLNDIAGTLQSLSNISNPKGLEKTMSNLEKLPYVFNNIDAGVLKNVARVSNELSEALSPLANKMGMISQGFSSMSQLADRYGVSVTKVREYTRQATDYTKVYSKVLTSMNRGFKNVQKSNEQFFKNLSRNASSVISKIKQIGLSLLGTRTIFTATRKAVSEYMAMDAELTWKVTNTWRAMGAQLAPVIENVIWLFKQFVRVIYSVVLALTGIDLIARANEKAMKGWGKSAKDTLGNLQKFDDLNVVEFPQSSGGGDDNKLIELDAIDLTPIQKIIDWVKKMRDTIKEAWDTGQWYGVGEVLAEGLNAAMKAINFDWIEEKFRNIATKFGDFLKGVFDNFDWEVFGVQLTRQLSLIPRLLTILFESIPWEELGTGLNKALQSFDVGFVIDSISNAIISLVKGVQTALLQIDGRTIGVKIGDAILSVFRNIDKLLDTIEWGRLGEKIQETILAIPWEDIFSSIIGMLTNALSSVGELLDGIFGTTLFGQIASDLNDIINNIVKIGKVTLDNLGESSTTGKIFKSLENIFKNVSGFAKDIADTLTEWIISDEFQGVISAIEDALGVIFDFADQTISMFKTWYEGEGGQQLRDILKTLTRIIKDCLEVIIIVVKEIYSVSKVIWETFILPALTRILKELNFWLGLLGDIISFVKNVFKGDWKAAFEDIQNIVDKVWKHIKDSFKNVINGWIGFFERGINGMIDKLNFFGNKINSLLGGGLAKELGINLQVKTIGHVSIPRLETGTNMVPEDGPYYLHANEAVIPKKYNPAYGGGTNEETNRKLDMLIEIMDNLETTTIVNIGNDRIYKQQQRYTRRQNDKYGTDVNL